MDLTEEKACKGNGISKQNTAKRTQEKLLVHFSEVN
jgi:hypothetical protein